ncbi:hypothetical protein [Saprospira grandis]|uniref:hypothetical protein n=1 Tax=Saprospira grandis TaxID=1008 RepID=UPI0022DE96B6|nr:hypothetical protein [Saprospira grandis]WBM75752.1 hypothetical protein OP864_05805 [Saprospira grandis]
MGAHHNHAIQDNPQFVFDGKLKMITAIMTLIGAISLGVTYFTDGDYGHVRFWTNLLHNTAFFTGIAFASLFFLSTHVVAWGGWQTIFKRVPEAMMMFMPVGLIFFALIAAGVYMDAEGTDYLYLWSDETALAEDHLVVHKSAFLNPFNYVLTLVVLGVWTLFAMMIRRLSLEQDGDRSLRKVNYEKIHMWSAIFLPIAGFSSAYAIWQWVMSVDVHWYSTLFAWYATVSVWVSAICIIFLLILFLQSRGHMQYFTKEHTHDLGKYIFGFSVFWTYLWFSQFLLIWYANNGEETQYFDLRFDQFPAVFYLNILLNFILPFFILMMNNSKRAKGTLALVAVIVLLGHWVDYFQMIKPGVWHNWEHAQHAGHGHGDDHGHGEEGHDAHGDLLHLNQAPKAVLTANPQHGDDAHGEEGHTEEAPATTENDSATAAETTAPAEAHAHDTEDAHATAHGEEAHTEEAHAEHPTQFVMGIHFPGLLELGTMIGFLGLFLFVTFQVLSGASLMPKNDPYVDESKHHHVWYDL